MANLKLPPNFIWINSIGTLPKMIEEGARILGVQEIPGPLMHPAIRQMAKELDLLDIYTSDDKMAWCALSHCAVANRAGKHIVFKDRYDYLRALSFAKLGMSENISNWVIIDKADAMFGDSLIFKRLEGGHVGMYIGESLTHFYVMGGNQNNMYSFTRISKERLFAVRRPDYRAIPEACKKYQLTDTGVPSTSNET